MPWRKREIREEDVRRFVATFEGKAKFLVDESFGVEAARVIRDLDGMQSSFATLHSEVVLMRM